VRAVETALTCSGQQQVNEDHRIDDLRHIDLHLEGEMGFHSSFPPPYGLSQHIKGEREPTPTAEGAVIQLGEGRQRFNPFLRFRFQTLYSNSVRCV
jgi:hypothetical protein